MSIVIARLAYLQIYPFYMDFSRQIINSNCKNVETCYVTQDWVCSITSKWGVKLTVRIPYVHNLFVGYLIDT